VYQDCHVERVSWQSRVVRLTKSNYNVLQTEIAYPTLQAPQIFGYYIFCNYAAVGADDRGQPHNVIAAPRTDVCDGHPGFDAEQAHELVDSPALSRSFSSCQIGLTMSATGRSGFGKALVGMPDSAMKSWAETEIDRH
jgi:hypothetical protein